MPFHSFVTIRHGLSERSCEGCGRFSCRRRWVLCVSGRRCAAEPVVPMLAGMAEIDDRVWSVWRERVAEAGADWALRMLFVSDGVDAEQVLAALRSSVRAVGAGYDELRSPAVWMRRSSASGVSPASRSGVVIDVTECDVFEDALPTIVAGRDGVGPRDLSVWEPPPVLRAPRKAALLVCRITVRGQRVGKSLECSSGSRTLTRTRRSSCRRVVVSLGPGAHPAALRASPGGPIALDLGESALDRLCDAFRRGVSAILTAIGDEQFRTIRVRASSGRISLVVGQQDPPPGWWKPPLREIVGHAASTRRSRRLRLCQTGLGHDQAFRHDGLADDWPARPHHEPWGPGQTRLAFDDVVAPDAFGVQLLGAGYAERVTPSAGWRTERLGGGSMLVEAADLDAWFRAPFVSGWPVGLAAADPRMLEHARGELDPILCSPATLRALGYPDVLEPGA